MSSKKHYRHHIIELINNWPLEVEKTRIILVDHFNLSHTEEFLMGLDPHNDLNPQGQLMLAKQLIKVIFGGQKDVLHYSHLNRQMAEDANHPVTWLTTSQAHPLSSKIQDLLNEKETINWLFMGDSITHGALHTMGYDSVPQLFEKYLINDLHRPQDLVMNTAISGVTTATTLDKWTERFEMFEADIVILMLGTNDTKQLSSEDFQNKFKEILNHYKNKGVPVIIRSLLPYYNLGSEEFVEKTKELYQITEQIAEEFEAVFIDQYHPFSEAINKYPYLLDPAFGFFNDKLHPANLGPLLMAKGLINGLGLTHDYSNVLNWSFNLPLETKILKVNVPVYPNQQNINIKVNDLKALIDEEISDVFIQISNNSQTYEAKVDSDITIPADIFKGSLIVRLFAKESPIVYLVTESIK